MNDTIMARLSIRIHLILCGLLFSISSYSTFPDKGRLYKTLDSLLSIQPQITQEKEERINFIQEAPKGPQVSDETRIQFRRFGIPAEHDHKAFLTNTIFRLT